MMSVHIYRTKPRTNISSIEVRTLGFGETEDGKVVLDVGYPDEGLDQVIMEGGETVKVYAENGKLLWVAKVSFKGTSASIVQFG